jgi:hypothetical protein
MTRITKIMTGIQIMIYRKRNVIDRQYSSHENRVRYIIVQT